MLASVLNKPVKTVIGLMSGTSLDGIDAAVMRIAGKGDATNAELIGYETFPYDDALRERLKQHCSRGGADAADICSMNFYLGERFAEAAMTAAERTGPGMGGIDLISSHGQTIWHIPSTAAGNPYEVRSTLQIGDISVIAKKTGKPVVGDYRPADMAVGGQGAPLVPYSDYILFRDAKKGRILQNIGGIGNCTAIPAGAMADQVIAFDTGPGNMVIDQAVHTLSGGTRSYDANGEWAASGRVNPDMLARMMQHPYFRLPPPKSTGRELFGQSFALAWIQAAKEEGMPDRDIVATVTAFTAESIVQSCRRFILPACRMDELILSGGGAHNRTLAGMIARGLPELKVLDSEQIGIAADAKEAAAFAVFANNFIHGCPNTLPAATGAARAVVMGKLALPD